MTLTVETGAGIAGADSYISLVDANAYWINQSHRTLAATWDAADDENKEGALREASAYIDATYGARFKGIPKGDVQGLLWPRSEAFDEAGYPMPDLPRPLATAAAELAARALSAPLAADFEATSGEIKRTTAKVGPLEETTEYFEGSSGGADPASYGMIDGILNRLLSPSGAWGFR